MSRQSFGFSSFDNLGIGCLSTSYSHDIRGVELDHRWAEDDHAAIAFHQRYLAFERLATATVYVDTLAIEVWLKGAYHIQGIPATVYADIIDDGDGLDVHGAHIGGEDWSARPLLYGGIRRQGDDENIAERFGELKVLDMYEARQVEYAMTQSDVPPGWPFPELKYPPELLDGTEFHILKYAVT